MIIVVLNITFFSSIFTEIIIFNGITIHNSGSEIINVFSKLVNNFPKIWEETSFTKLSVDNWMQILFKSDWESKVTGKTKIYFFGIKNR